MNPATKPAQRAYGEAQDRSTLEILAVDDLRLEVRRSPRRRTLGLTVDRGGELVISAPHGLDDRTLRAFVREKKLWIHTKRAEKSLLRPPTGTKEFVTGEGFHYLGRSYRLLLVAEQDAPLKLEAGRFRLLRSETAHGREHLIRWYCSHAAAWIARRVEHWAPQIAVKPLQVRVRDLAHRWGSCGKGGSLNFHWAVILLPPSVVDYVIVHELVHLREANHTPEFWRRVERALPDYEGKKSWLAERAAEFVAL